MNGIERPYEFSIGRPDEGYFAQEWRDAKEKSKKKLNIIQGNQACGLRTERLGEAALT